MKSRLLVLVMLLLAMLPVAAEELAVTVDGEAAGSGISGKEKAVENALRAALEKGYGVYIDAVTLAENAALISDEIVAETKGFIRSYDVLDSREEEGLCRVKVRAVIAMDRLWESDSLQLLLQRMGMPRFVVISLEEEQEEAVKGSPAQQKLTEMLTARGFYLVNSGAVSGMTAGERGRALADLEQAAAMGQRAGADIVVLLKANAAFEERNDRQGIEMHFFNGYCEARVIQVDSRKIVAAATGKSRRGARYPEEAIRDSLAFAAQNAADPLLKNMLAAWSQGLNQGRSIEVVVQPLAIAELSRLIDKMKGFEGVSAVSQRDYANRKATLWIKSKHPALVVAEELEKLGSPRLQVLNLSDNRIELKKIE